MSVIGSNILAGASGNQGGGYNLTNSLRFRSSASAKLTRTPSTAGDRRTFTTSMWLKRGSIIVQELFSANANGTTYPDAIYFDEGSKLSFYFNGGVSYINYTPGLFRDPSAWYHFVVAIDTTQATNTNRVKIYVNGVQQTLTGSFPIQNYQSNFNSVIGHQIGSSSFNNYFDGYMTEINFIDGQALTPSSFGETNADTGVWQPKKYVGTYGTNGFYLPFTDNSALTTSSNVGLGKDFSGNGNYWATNNISITAGATYDSMTDVPTLTSATASNFAVINPLENLFGAAFTVSQANLRATSTTTLASLATIALPSSGKYYFEYLCNGGDSNEVGLYAESTSEWRTYDKGGQKYSPAGYSSYGSSWTTNDVISVAVDMSSGKLWFAKNGTWQASGDPAAGTNAAFTDVNTAFATEPPFFYAGAYNGTHTLNFGQRPFTYTPPTGFVALNTFNLPTPTIGATASTQANKYFDATTYTGNGTSQSIVNSGAMQPDWVWVKSRSAATSHIDVDVLRGTSNVLVVNGTAGDQNISTYVTALNSNGFSVGNGSGADINDINNSGGSFVGWQWKANGTGVSNTAGSITSTVSANTSAGFSVVTYTGNGTAGATVGHGLGVAPAMIIIKNRSAGSHWPVYHKSLPVNQGIYLSLTQAADVNSNYNSTAPTSTVFSIGDLDRVNANGDSLVAYCFSEVAGYSKFGSYTGNGSTDGTFVYTGFRPRYIMLKRTDTTANWTVYDTSRSTYNQVSIHLRPNTSQADDLGTDESVDILSNGFKLKGTSSQTNASGGTYIYMAIAENPFKYSLAR
jgi:hypothetical protein